MPPVLPLGRYIISIPTEAGTYYIGPLQDMPDTLGILRGDVDPPIFVLENAGEDDEYNMSIHGKWVGKKDDGGLCLKRADEGHRQKWKIQPSGAGYKIKGEEGSCWSLWSFAVQNLDNVPIKDRLTCAKCPQTCRCSQDSPCEHQNCIGCKTGPPEPTEEQNKCGSGSASSLPSENVGTVVFDPGDDCSGCPSPCLIVAITPAN